MNPKIIAGIVVLVVGVIVLVVLTTLGGVAKKTIHDTVNSRLEYELPDGYKSNPNFEHCYHNDIAAFDEEYYLWNLTNLPAVLTGGVPNYNLTGPYSYAEWYCEYNHKIDEKAGVLTYKRYSQGYHFIPNANPPQTSDADMITNINPGYMGLLQKFGGDDTIIPYFLAPTFLEGIVAQLADPANQQKVRIGAVPTVLSGINSQIIATAVGQTLLGYLTFSSGNVVDFFSFPYQFGPTTPQVPGWTTYIQSQLPGVNTTLAAATQQALYNQWFTPSNPTGLLGFLSTVSANPALGLQFGLTANQTAATLQYLNAITQPIIIGARPTVYSYWANGTAPSGSSIPAGWAIGTSTAPTGISFDNVAALFDAKKTCNLVNSTEYKVWTDALGDQTLVPVIFSSRCSDLSLTQPQVVAILTWLGTVFTAVGNGESNLLLQTWGLTENGWNDFAYAQWGQWVAGSLGGAFNPEVGAFNSPNCKFNLTESKIILSTSGLLNVNNLLPFVIAVTSGDFASIQKGFPFLDVTRIGCLAGYMQTVVVPNLINPWLTANNYLTNDKSGMFVTRSVRDWIFNAQDPFLALLGQPSAVGLKKNNTQTKENAVDRNYRIYTGKNELHWALMPFNAGEELTFWRQNVSVTGYNGSQFLTHGYLDDSKKLKEYPLNLYHEDITRPIPFVKVGKQEWNGVKVRYLTYSPKALQSDVQNPENYPYYAQFDGVVNKTSSVGLPVFLSTPNMESAEEAFKQNVVMTDTLYGDYNPNETMSHHRRAMFLLVEPTLGSSVWGNLPIQINMKYSATTRYPGLLSSVAPVYWNAIGDIATKHDLDDIKDSLYANQRLWKVLIGLGVGVGVALIITGIVLIAHFRKHENELKESSG